MFMGEYQHTIDNKGRLILPAKFRDELGEVFIATKGLDNCLFVYTKNEWAILEEKLKKLPLAKPEARAFVRFFFSGAAELECDKQGRVLLPNNLREYATLEKDVVVIGVSNRIEIWDETVWDKYNEEVSPTVAQIAENLADLGI
ncbi:MAG TPA: division/cell wall cluster transcriptional repressor MraZ [Methylomusa anaerophila]|uniref:Transcriptional regulator MraZ n=1 Tax=Methylomusa anaerophila TaxID=1930071 RepID=A0A348AQC2_9FIRM|nr:division/cell wall cluster transcriptional repressor MraZ [Methylomusa anaerophila]BBB93270.1 cell division protein MraZ [Methylomusa anaerophila]HML86898.1 division/cell wall cluster transcriptional repressor MraZ [Methylomusa anaerophila]